MAKGADSAVGVVERRALMHRLPQSERTWVKFRGGAYSGANLFAFRDPKVASALTLWRGVEKDRKKALKLLWKIGPTIFWNAILGRRTLDETLRKVSRRVGVVIRAVEPADAIAAIDVDKTSDLEMVEQILASRA
jgi:hypothetical protein